VLIVQMDLTDSRVTANKAVSSFQVKTLHTIMKELGHDWVDVLKIDIEGNEWAVLKDLIGRKEGFPCTQMQVSRLGSILQPQRSILYLSNLLTKCTCQNVLEQGCPVQIEFHYWRNSAITKPREMLEVLKGLRERQMRVFNVEPNWWWENQAFNFVEFAFVQVKTHPKISSAFLSMPWHATPILPHS
jgi:hypothetical protein